MQQRFTELCYYIPYPYSNNTLQLSVISNISIASSSHTCNFAPWWSTTPSSTETQILAHKLLLSHHMVDLSAVQLWALGSEEMLVQK
mmetsp:Transcript_27323/g.46474  ORF Transcript_27323/g.46474 Transcript_27323/m.46474 type:complete len:87 (-) Transcript_27323:727-987(-)